MTIARTAATATTLALALFAGACGGKADEAEDLEMQPPAATTPTPAPAADSAAGNRLAFTPVGASTLTGEVDVEEEGAGTKVEVKIANSTDGAVHKGHIHSGTCAAPGAVVAPLGDITIDGDRNGESETTLQLPMMTVMNGQHIVAFHAAGGNPGAPVLCVAIPAHSM